MNFDEAGNDILLKYPVLITFISKVKLYKQAKAWDKAILALEQCRLCNEKLNEYANLWLFIKE